MDKKRLMLQHFLAAIAYRTQKALREAPPGFAEFRAAPGVRTPHELIFHITGVLGYARTFLTGGTWRPIIEEDFPAEVNRFHSILTKLRELLESNTPFENLTPERMLQGPLSDAMSHAGQLAMLRRFFGSPIRPENFIMADINAENTGENQPEPISPDDEWLDAEGAPQGRQ
ncbi:MAG: hypothetical protein HN356_00355 [Calditrichaeota bacterium]|jgi:hypothetical protein|nr:hypothetical protein [Calditrichota bacterium]MBT7616474.1 hypothetical protein [Calditrichota bacterium]